MEATAGRRRPRVLLVEDDARLRELFADWLAVLGCQADAAANGIEGVGLFDEGGYDLVVTDLIMPLLNGWQLVEAVRRRDPALPVIMVTGSATNLDTERRRATRVTLLQKPISLSTFKGALAQALGARPARPDPEPCQGSFS